jgi:hypothetical protein
MKPAALGVIGKQHFEHHLDAMGGVPGSFQYKRIETSDDEERPVVIEVALAYGPHDAGMQLFTGVNWSPAINNPIRQLGANGAGLERVLSGQLCQSHDPIIVAVHLVSPKIHWLDRGKGISLRGPDGDGIRDEFEEGEYYARETIPDDGSVASKLIAAVKVVTKRWRKQKLQEIHHHELGSDDARR